MQKTVEIVLFRLKAGSDVSEFLKAAQATFDLLAGYEGYLDRELSVSEDGLWVDVVHWADMSTAMHAAETLMNDPIGQAFGDFIDPDTIQMQHTLPQLYSLLKPA